MNSAARVEEGLAEAARVLPPAPSRLRPYLRLAFLDPSNLLILGLALAAGLGRGLWAFSAAVILAEALWLILAPRLAASRRALDARFESQSAAGEKQRRAALLQDLSAGNRARVESLIDLRQSLLRRATSATGAASDGLLDALSKCDALFGLCVLEARRSARLKTYLAELDPEQIARDLRRLSSAGGESDLELARQRQARAREGQSALAASEERLAQLENALRAVASPALAGEGEQTPLGELLSGVDALVQAKHPQGETTGSWTALMHRTP